MSVTALPPSSKYAEPLAYRVTLDALYLLVDPKLGARCGDVLRWDMTDWRVHTIAWARHRGWPAIYVEASPL